MLVKLRTQTDGQSMFQMMTYASVMNTGAFSKHHQQTRCVIDLKEHLELQEHRYSKVNTYDHLNVLCLDNEHKNMNQM